jgi:hypothetical protein
MAGQLATTAEAAPLEWRASAPPTDSRLHQLAPYIGKLLLLVSYSVSLRLQAMSYSIASRDPEPSRLKLYSLGDASWPLTPTRMLSR